MADLAGSTKLLMATVVSALVVSPNPQVVLPSDQITYDLMVQFRNGPQLVEGVTPSDERPDPAELDTLSKKPNSLVFGLVDHGIIRWFFDEREARGPCDPKPGDAGSGSGAAGGATSESGFEFSKSTGEDG